VRAGGKSLLLLNVAPELVKPLLKEFGADGLFIQPAKTFETEQAAEDFIHQVEDWSS